jgi:SAM-dependent methyltransferase
MQSEKSRADIAQLQYRQRFSAAMEYRHALWGVLCREFFQQYIAPGSVLLDLGCGWGEFSNNIIASKKYAMDMNPDAAQRLNDDVELVLQDCSRPWPLPSGSLDVVFTSNFLEHLPHKSNVESTIAEVKRCLKPGGIFIAIGPNVRLVPGAYWDFWDHHVHLTERSLAELLTMNDFTVTERHAAFLPYTMSDGRHPSLLLVKLYLRMRFIWKILGKQFLVVAHAGK